MASFGLSSATSEDSPIRPFTRILMLGTSAKGGVTSVIRCYEEGGLFEEWPITYLPTHMDGGLLRKAGTALAAWMRFAGWLVRERAFLIHVHCASRASFWRKATYILPAVWARHPVIFHLHGAEFMQFYGEDCGPMRQWLVRYVLRHCTEIVVLSESWRASIATITDNGNISVIANPVAPFQAGSAARARMPGSLLFLGRLGERKGIYILLDALARVSERYPEVRLFCGGDGDIQAARLAAARFGVEDRVEFLGWVDGSRRAELLATASVYVLPSFAEGMPMGILEAMSAGLPVVSTPVGGIPEAITDGEEGLLVAPGDAVALSDVIARLLGDPGLRSAMGSRAREKFDKHFNVEIVLPQVGAIYRRLGVRSAGAA